MPFHILSLSGGGYRGLFTAEVLARLEQQAGRPIGECFDLIAGTSIGGIIAIGLGMGGSAADIRDAFLEDGERIFPGDTPKTFIGRSVALFRTVACRPKNDGMELRRTIERIVGSTTLLSEARTRLLIPSINMTAGRVQMFKTPHHPSLRIDGQRLAADVGMATSAAPLFFPLAKIGNSFFADGGLAANSPDACAIHEAIQFAQQSRDDLRILSIGTTSSQFGLPSSLGRHLRGYQWLAKQRLVTTVFGVQQQLVDFMIGHDYPNAYLRIDAHTSAEQAVDVALDLATQKRRDTLRGLAETAYQQACVHPLVLEALAHQPSRPEFVQRRDEGADAFS